MAETETDPVCGMTVAPETNPELHVDYQGRRWWFCGKGCLLDFKDSPDTYTDPEYQPSGM
jgi:YHS domain-containing protein